MSILEDARAVVAEGPVCDPCLGRCFADRSFGLTNRERGRALRTAVALDEDDPFEEPGDCWVCEGYSAEFGAWADRITEELAGTEFASYQVGTKTPPLVAENESLLRESAGLAEDAGESFKSEFNREVGKRVGTITGADVDFERPDVLAVIDLAEDTVDVQVNAAFVYGRYRKLARGIPQTEWPCGECGGYGLRGDEVCPTCKGTGYQYPLSVEQLTAPVVEDAMDGEDSKFHGAGREDIDALMLGTGRPFVVEVESPKKRFPDVDELESEINEFAGGKAEVEGLRLASYEMVERVKEHDADKTYRAEVEFDAPVTGDELADALAELEDTTIEQRTPERVSHRRADKVRERRVLEISGDMEDETHATVEVLGEGGLYIKELVSGDNGRTNPSLAGILDTGAVVTALDVVSVEGTDEPFERDEFFLDA